MGEALRLFAELTVAFAGAAIGLSAIIVARYWQVWRATYNGARLLPAHVMLIGTSYSMIALVAVVRLGDPPSPDSMPAALWWIYPWVTAAFLLGDVALVLILRFTAARGTRVGSPRWGRRSTDRTTRELPQSLDTDDDA